MPLDNYHMEVLRRVGPEAPTTDQKLELLQMLRASTGDNGREVDRFLVADSDMLRIALMQARNDIGEARETMAKIYAPPYYPAIFIRAMPVRVGEETSDRALVQLGSSRKVLETADSVNLPDLKRGDPILVNDQGNLVLQRMAEEETPWGELSIFERFASDGRLVVTSENHEYIVGISEGMDREGLRKGNKIRWDKHTLMALEKVTDDRPDHLFLEGTPEETFAGIGGLDAQIRQIKQTIQLHMEHADTTRKYGLKPKRSILLVGPAGTGKTMMARAMANWVATLSQEGKSRFINVKPSGLHSMWYGKTEENYREVFRLARQAGEEQPEIPVVVFFDEVDSVGLTRGTTTNFGINDRVLTAFMAELDGLEDRGNILVVAATNRRTALDPALLRPGRLGDLILDIPRPSGRAARDIFTKYLTADLPYHLNGDGSAEDVRKEIVDAALGTIYSADHAMNLATVTLADGRKQAVEAGDLLSGAVIQKVVQAATERACVREIGGGEEGVQCDDVLACLVDEFQMMASTLTRDNIRAHIPSIPDSCKIVSVEVLPITAPTPTPSNGDSHERPETTA